MIGKVCLDRRNHKVREGFMDLGNPNVKEDLSRFKESYW